jgi:hypothetical protein
VPARAYTCPQSDLGVSPRCWSDTQCCRARPGTRPDGTYGDKAKPSALRQRNRRLCCIGR